MKKMYAFFCFRVMEKARLAKAIIAVIEQNRCSTKQLADIALSLPRYLAKIVEDFEKMERDIEDLRQENNLLLFDFDRQEEFNFNDSVAGSQSPGAGSQSPGAGSQSPGADAVIIPFKVVGE